MNRLTARLSAAVAWCVAGPQTSSSYLLRARFLVIGAAAISAAAIPSAVLYAASPDTTWAPVGCVAALAIPGLLIPFLLRRGLRLPVLGSAFVLVLQAVLTVSAFLDRGLGDVALFWLIATPLFAAFVGGRGAGWLTATTAGLAGVVLLVATEMGYPFPDLMDPVFARRYHVVNFAAAGLFVAGLAWLYEGPFVRRLRALTRQLRETNRNLRQELEARRRAQAAAEAANRAKDVLLSNMSHELRTPLTAILSGTELLTEGASEDDRLVLGSIQRGGERLLRTLEGVLDLAWHEGAGAAPALAPVEVGAAVEEAAAPFQVVAKSKGIDLEVSGDGVWAQANDAALRRAVAAVVDNAVRFTEVGRATVAVAIDGPHAIVEVADTGIGMSADFLPHAAESFRQASDGDGRTHEGLGLGLTLALRLVEQMDGRLRIKSAPGRGTTVRIELPVATPASDEPATGQGEPVSALSSTTA